jgi:general secretion pathway protein A
MTPLEDGAKVYKRHFGLKDKPFSLYHRAPFVFHSRELREALAHFHYVLDSREPFFLLTGEVGAGKTTSIRELRQQVPDTTVVGVVEHTALTPRELLEEIAAQFGLKPGTGRKRDLLKRLENHLTKMQRKGQQGLLIIDEAQLLTSAALEELRLLSNLEGVFGKLLVICLVGQVELEAKLRHKKHRSLRQRTTVRYRLKCLNIEETQDYLAHRLAVAGSDDAEQVFSREAVAALFKLSRGIPREVNILADRSLLNAYLDDEKTVAPRHVEAVPSEFGFEGVAVGTHR